MSKAKPRDDKMLGILLSIFFSPVPYYPVSVRSGRGPGTANLLRILWATGLLLAYSSVYDDRRHSKPMQEVGFIRKQC
jgi:hypothetical protein